MASEPLANQPFLVRNLKRTLRNLLAVGQIFAVVPWDVEPFEPEPAHALCWFRKFIRVAHAVYSIVIIVAVGAATLFHHSDIVSSDFFAIRTLYFAEHIITNIIILLIMTGGRFLRTFYSTFGNEVLSIGHSLYICEASIDFRLVEIIINRLVTGSLLYFCSLVVLDFLFNADTSCEFICRTLVYTLPNTIHVFALHQYVAMQLLVCYFFRLINEVLVRYGDRSSKKVSDCTKLLERLRKAHLRLTNLTTQLNDRFGILILCTVLSSFVVLNLQLFNLYKVTEITRNRIWNSNDTLQLAYILMWIGLHAAKILLILFPVHRGRLERDRTGPTLYQFALPCATNDPASDVSMKFAGQLLHGTRPYKACGVITLDLTLISKIVAALTTYLVILIQFDSTFSPGSI
uniref:Gustatory receptor n=1 Tax=Anopheles minimus TaxID=112268 RepID=A0A182WIB5_9DIPT